MTRIRAGVVDVYVIRRTGRGWRVLTLRRAENTRSTGSWETVHGRIEPREKPVVAATRELREETGLAAERLYAITVNPFYLARLDTIEMAVVFAAFVRSKAVTLGPEHDAFAWLSVAAARSRFAWPREGEALTHIRKLLGTGEAGAVEDVLRVL